MVISLLRSHALTLCALLVLGCSTGHGEADSDQLAGHEAGVDAPASHGEDTTTQMGPDASTNAAADAAREMGADGSLSAREAGASGRESGIDTASPDAAADAGARRDAGPLPENTIFVSPNGKDDASGTMQDPTTFSSALKRVVPGGVVALRGGTYSSATQLTIEAANSGTADKPKTLRAYADEKPIFDFFAEPYGSDNNARGLQINADYWHVIGLEVKNSADNGIYVAGSHNVIEACVTHGNRDTGLQLGRASSSDTMADWPAGNLILNCESYDNYDAPPGSGENADGFAAKLTVGPDNVFRGCYAHNNIDDGWDLYTKSDTGPIGAVTIDQCIAQRNGTLSDGTTNANGDRNGFKLGGEKIAVNHTVTRSIAFANGKNGFTWNSNPGAIRLFNNLAFDNAQGNFSFGSSSVSTEAVFANNISFWTSLDSDQSDKTVGTDLANSNAFWDASKGQPSSNGKGLIVSAADFARPLASVSVTRNPDGSLNFAPFSLAAGSDLLNAGTSPAGALPFESASYYVGVPDLGAVEAR
jgi:hypothetical protein